jgi:hypothetical protein
MLSRRAVLCVMGPMGGIMMIVVMMLLIVRVIRLGVMGIVRLVLMNVAVIRRVGSVCVVVQGRVV